MKQIISFFLSFLHIVSSTAINGSSKSTNLAGTFHLSDYHFYILRFVVLRFNQLLLLQPMLQELGKQNPQLLRIIQEHHAEFLQLINEPLDGSEG